MITEQKRHGCYYTPPALVERLLAATLEGLVSGPTICDPACGTGNILEPAARFGTVFGMERDPQAAQICRDRLRLGPERIRCGDALFDEPGQCDVVVGNPPWVSFSGRHSARAETYRRRLVAAYPAVARWPSLHGAFLVRAAQMARHRIGLLLPRQVAEQTAYAGARQAVANLGFQCRTVIDLGEQAFDGVTQAVGLFVYHRRSTDQSSEFKVQPDALDALDRWPRFAPNTFSDPGVHTGNMARKLIRDAAEGECVPIREGRDVGPNHCGPPRRWLNLCPKMAAGDYCRVGPLSGYAAVPILIRQTADRPIAALHETPTYFRNSLLACRGVPGVPHAVTVAVLNSKLFAILHRRNTVDARQKAFPQVKVRHLQALPEVPRDRTFHQALLSAPAHQHEALICAAYGLNPRLCGL